MTAFRRGSVGRARIEGYPCFRSGPLPARTIAEPLRAQRRDRDAGDEAAIKSPNHECTAPAASECIVAGRFSVRVTDWALAGTWIVELQHQAEKIGA